jgi:membrane fusion protein, multidrug efflux system
MNRSFTLFVLLAAALTLVACSQEGATPAQAATTAPPPLPADVQHVADAMTNSAATTTAAVASDKFTATGEFVSPSRSELSPVMPGRVAAIYVDHGSRVQRGQPLLALESDYQRLEAQRAEADLARATAAAEEARRDFDRKKELRAKDSVPQAAFDRSQAVFEQTVAARQVAASTLAMARQRVDDSVLRSPINGAVAERRVDVGERLGEAGVAFVIYQTAPLKLRFNVPERFFGHLRPGQTVAASVDPYPNEVFSGSIRTVGGVIDPQTRTFFAEAEFSNRDGRLTPGLFARVEVDLK